MEQMGLFSKRQNIFCFFVKIGGTICLDLMVFSQFLSTISLNPSTCSLLLRLVESINFLKLESHFLFGFETGLVTMKDYWQYFLVFIFCWTIKLRTYFPWLNFYVNERLSLKCRIFFYHCYRFQTRYIFHDDYLSWFIWICLSFHWIFWF